MEVIIENILVLDYKTWFIFHDDMTRVCKIIRLCRCVEWFLLMRLNSMKRLILLAANEMNAGFAKVCGSN
jgi:hypothetical protein